MLSLLRCVDGRNEPLPPFALSTPFPRGMSAQWREAGTPSSAIFDQRAPRQPCRRSRVLGYVEVAHRVSLHYQEKLGLWMNAANGSGLWYPPRRLLICHDSLDLAIHLNHSSAGDAWRGPYKPGVLIPQCASDLTCNSKTLRNNAKYALFDYARRALDGKLDTIVLTHHLDVSYTHLGVLVGELFALPSSNVYHWKRCPSSDRFRKGNSTQALRLCDCRRSPVVPQLDPNVC